MAIIDSQVHSYEANTPKRPWHTVPNWPDHVTGDEMVAAMDTVGVDGAICISAWLLLDSRVVDLLMAYNPTFVMLSFLKPLFFNRLENELRFSDNAGA